MDEYGREVLYPLTGMTVLSRFLNSKYTNAKILEDVFGIKPEDVPARLLFYAVRRAGSYEDILKRHGIETVGHQGEDHEKNLVLRVFDPSIRERFGLKEYYMYIDPGAQGDQTPTFAWVEGFDSYQAASEALEHFLPPRRQ